MGDSADDILQTFRIDEGTVAYEDIKNSFKDYFFFKEKKKVYSYKIKQTSEQN